MSVLYLKWNLTNSKQEQVERYCKQCGKVVTFQDSLRRRQNANGKDIYEYAIYKCEKDHTWNNKLQTMKAYSGMKNPQELLNFPIVDNEEIYFEKIKDQGITLIQIDIEYVEKRQRLDSTLSSQIKDMSRSAIQKWIKQGFIQVNNGSVPCNYPIRIRDIIIIRVEELNTKGEINDYE